MVRELSDKRDADLQEGTIPGTARAAILRELSNKIRRLSSFLRRVVDRA